MAPYAEPNPTDSIDGGVLVAKDRYDAIVALISPDIWGFCPFCHAWESHWPDCKAEPWIVSGKPHSDLDTIDLEHDMGIRDLTNQFGGE